MIAAAQLWWHVARSSGLMAWAALAAAMLWGLLLSTRVLGRRPSRPWLVDSHRYISALALFMIALHLTALYLDSYVEFSVPDLVVPMAAGWRPGALAWGIVALYIIVVVEATSLFAARLPRRWWRAIHETSFVAFVFATVHGLLAGTDATNPVARGVLVIAVAELFFVTAVRLRYRRQSWQRA